MKTPSTCATWSTTSPPAIDFYTTNFGFTVGLNAAPAFARRDPRQPAAAPERSGELGGSGHGRRRGPGPGGWNRVHFITDDLDGDVERLRAAGVRFRNDVVVGPGRLTDPGAGPGREPDRALPARRPLLNTCHRAIGEGGR